MLFPGLYHFICILFFIFINLFVSLFIFDGGILPHVAYKMWYKTNFYVLENVRSSLLNVRYTVPTFFKTSLKRIS